MPLGIRELPWLFHGYVKKKKKKKKCATYRFRMAVSVAHCEGSVPMIERALYIVLFSNSRGGASFGQLRDEAK
jgi:hypothetical protein